MAKSRTVTETTAVTTKTPHLHRARTERAGQYYCRCHVWKPESEATPVSSCRKWLLGRDWIQKFSLDLQELKTGTPTQLHDKVCREEPATTGRKRTTKKKFATDEVNRPTEANVFRRGRERKWRQITARKRNSSKRQYHRNDTVYAKGFSNRDPKWVCGKITKVHGKSIAVTLNSGETICRHIQHIRVCARDPSNTQRNRTCTLNTAVGSKSPTERIT